MPRGKAFQLKDTELKQQNGTFARHRRVARKGEDY
jgi:hypothetical protein